MDEIPVPNNAFLEVIEGPEEGSVFTLLGKTVTVGRTPTCDITLSDPYVSKKHCQVVFRRDHFTVMDLGSTNRTRVNGKVFIQKNLRNGDVVRLGTTELRFIWEDLDESVIDALEDVLGEDDDRDDAVPAEET